MSKQANSASHPVNLESRSVVAEEWQGLNRNSTNNKRIEDRVHRAFLYLRQL
jgi:hypothetical protein